MLRVLELFAGIGACSKALERLKIDHEIVDAVEIDKYAIASFNAIHGTNFEPQDITKWDKDIQCDLIMHGSPCQDFSVAGKQAGGDKDSGTRSSLMYETLRIVEKLKPKYVIWENVKNLLSAKHRHNFDAYLERMTELGYKNYYQVLNAKDYGMPQNRERVFTVSIRLDVPYCWAFEFPARRLLIKRLKDVLETEVDEKYYLSDKAIAGYTVHTDRHKERGNGFKFEPTDGNVTAHTISTRAGQRSTDNFVKERHGKASEIKNPLKGKTDYGWHFEQQVYDKDGVTRTVKAGGGSGNIPKVIEPFVVASRGRSKGAWHSSTHFQKLEPRTDGNTNSLSSVQKDNYVAIKTANKTGYDFATDGDGIDLAYPDSKTRRGRVGHGVSKTLPTSDSQGVMDGYRIRKLTPIECWRLMGFDDADFYKAEKVNSNTQLYKQAGNSIVVNVLEEILKELLDGEEN